MNDLMNKPQYHTKKNTESEMEKQVFHVKVMFIPDNTS